MKSILAVAILFAGMFTTCLGNNDLQNLDQNNVNPKTEIMKIINSFQPEVKERLTNIMDSPSFSGVIYANDAVFIAEKMGKSVDKVMEDLRPIAALYAKAAISNYKVGVVCRGGSGNLYFGGNIEFPGEALSFTIHSEQAAVINAWINGETELVSLDVGGSPCGYCLQFLNELVTAPTLQIMEPKGPSVKIKDLLTQAFGPRNLGVEGGLMKKYDHELELCKESDDKLVNAALKAANMSYAPYSKSYSGIALATKNGKIFIGPYAENAAFNPSMSPLETAIAHFNLSAIPYTDIDRVVLVEMVSPRISQVSVTESVLNAIAPNVRLTIVSAQKKD